MDEKSEEALSGVDGEAMLTADLGNSDSFVAGAESLSDSFKSFISSPTPDSEALVDTLISDSTVTSKDEEEVAPNPDCQEPMEVNQTPTSTTETVTTTSDEAITTSDVLTVSNDTTANVTDPSEASTEITLLEKVDEELCVSEASTLTLTGANMLENETGTVSDDKVISEPEHIECKPDMLSKALEAMETDTLDSADDVVDKTSAESQDLSQTEDVEVKDEEVPVLKVPEEELSDSRTVSEWKSKDDTMCDLEEELKRLHEGDTPESEAIIESSLSLHPAVTMAKKAPISNINGSTALTKVSKIVPVEEDKPIIKDSDLEEMLAADVILKDADLIQESQKDLRTTDLLVCGRCHEVFHFVEEFQQHKSSPCLTMSKVLSTCENESKPQVWGFTLWKNKQFKLVKPGAPLPSSWNVYQKWCKMAENDKKAWIAAGQTLQFCNRIGLAKLTEVKVKSPQKLIEKDPLALDGFMENKENTSTLGRSLRVNKEIAIIPKEENTNRALRTVRSTETKEFAVEKIIAKRFNPKRKTWEYNIKWEHFPSEENTWEPVANLGHCKKMIDQFEEQLKKLKMEKAKQAANVPKVKAKKEVPAVYSPPSSSRTPSSTGRPQRQCKQKALSQVKAWCGNISDDEEGVGGGLKRPFDDDDSDESYEKKMKFEEETDDSDFDSKAQVIKLPSAKKDPITPKGTPIVVKNGTSRGTPLPENILIPDANGVVRINQKQLPSLSTGVYIMSKTAGIIKLDSATSKVATSGGPTVVKVTPKIGQTQIKIVKKDGTVTGTQQVIQYNPKTGVHQTQPVLRIAPKALTPAKSTPTKVFKPVITKVKKLSDIAPVDTKDASKTVIDTTKVATAESPKKVTELKKITEVTPKVAQKIKTAFEKQRRSLSVSEPPTADEESDDGLEELPFPDDIKVPEPESPPGEFSLDPFTGKLAGVEYPDPVPEPEPTIAEEEKVDESSLDNIVKLAAADITEEDLKADTSEAAMELEPEPIPEPDQLEIPIEEEKEKSKLKSSPLVIRKTDLTPASIAAVAAKPIMRVTMASTPIKRSTPASILNRALTGSPQVIRKTIVSSPALVGQQRVQQRILNPTLNRTTVLNPIIRTGNTYARAKQVAPKPKFNIATYNSPARLAKAAGTPVLTKATYVTKVSPQSMGRKIGSTTIRSTPIINQIKPQTRIVHTSASKYSINKGKESLLLRGHPDRRSMPLPQKPKPKTVISMPSLIGDDDSMPPLSMGESMVTMKTSPQIQMMEQEPEIHMPAVESSLISTSTPTVMDPIITPVSEGVAAVASTSSNMAVHQEQQQQQPELAADMSSFTLADSDNPIFITGDDGTVYQVAGQNEQGQTILLTQDANGQQQCLLVTNELAENMETPVAEQPQVAETPVSNISIPEIAPEVTEPLQVKTDPEDTSDQVVAQVVRAEPPSPGGTHKVVVMLPDGNLMVTHVSPEEYASLELD